MLPLLSTPRLPYTTLFRSARADEPRRDPHGEPVQEDPEERQVPTRVGACRRLFPPAEHRRCRGHHHDRSEEHTSELQSRGHLVCRLLLEKKKRKYVERQTT